MNLFELPVTELMSDEIYNFDKTERNWDFYHYPEDIYSIMKSELNCHYIFWRDWRNNQEHYKMNIQQIQALYKSRIFSVIDFNLPLFFVTFTLLLENFMFENFRNYALKFLKWFDAEKYRHTYELSAEEFDELKIDLAKAINLLENYNERNLIKNIYTNTTTLP